MIYSQNVSVSFITRHIDLAAYLLIVFVYIASLTYMKASTRMSAKLRYLEHKYPSKINKKLNLKKYTKKSKTANSTMKSIINLVKFQINNPHLHLYILRFCTFGWIYLYFCFQSVLPLIFLLHSIIYTSRPLLLTWLKFVYTPGLWLIFSFNYIVNIKGMFDDSIYKKENNRFGIFNYKPAFIHLLFQLFTCFYCCFVLYMFRVREEYLQLLAKAKLEKQKKLASKLVKTADKFRRSTTNLNKTNTKDQIMNIKLKNVFIYEVILRFLLKQIDIALMIVIYICGWNRADVYHWILLTLFAVYIMYPDKFKRNFILFLYFMSFIISIK